MNRPVSDCDVGSEPSAARLSPLIPGFTGAFMVASHAEDERPDLRQPPDIQPPGAQPSTSMNSREGVGKGKAPLHPYGRPRDPSRVIQGTGRIAGRLKRREE